MIVVTTPTGAIGSQVVEKLLGRSESVRVIVRNPSRLPSHVREGVDIVAGSHSDADVVDRAFDGADAVFWLVPSDPRADGLQAAYVDFTHPACEAFKTQEVGRVVGVSALGRGVNSNAGLVSASLAMDDAIAATGVGYRALTMPSFMDNVLRQIEPIKNQGVFFSPISPDLQLPTCATSDIATVAAELLLDDSWSGQGSVAVLGPEDLSHHEMAQIMSEVLGKPVRYQQISFEKFKAELMEKGASEAFAQGMVDMMAAKNTGLDNAEPRTPQSTTPTSFRRWCENVLRPAVLA
jgi:uncharacterized protein YbjT (DUF2867 family)